MAWDCRGTRRRWRNIWCPDRDAVAAAESIRVSRGSRGRARPAPFPHCPSRRFAGPAQNLGLRKNLVRAGCAGTSKAAGDRTNAGPSAASRCLCHARLVDPVLAEGDNADHRGIVESTPDLAGPEHALAKELSVFLGVCRPLNQSNAASNEARTTRAAASMSASTRRCNIGGAGLNNRHRTRRRAGGTPPAALPAGLQRSGQGRPRARPRRASRPR